MKEIRKEKKKNIIKPVVKEKKKFQRRKVELNT